MVRKEAKVAAKAAAKVAAKAAVKVVVKAVVKAAAIEPCMITCGIYSVFQGGGKPAPFFTFTLSALRQGLVGLAQGFPDFLFKPIGEP